MAVPFYANLTIDIVLLIVIHISGVCQPDSSLCHYITQYLKMLIKLPVRQTTT
jgi:hypothetical protein